MKTQHLLSGHCFSSLFFLSPFLLSPFLMSWHIPPFAYTSIACFCSMYILLDEWSEDRTNIRSFSLTADQACLLTAIIDYRTWKHLRRARFSLYRSTICILHSEQMALMTYPHAHIACESIMIPVASKRSQINMVQLLSDAGGVE